MRQRVLETTFPQYRFDLLKVHIRHSGEFRPEINEEERATFLSAYDDYLIITHTQLILKDFNNSILMVRNFENKKASEIFWGFIQDLIENERI